MGRNRRTSWRKVHGARARHAAHEPAHKAHRARARHAAHGLARRTGWRTGFGLGTRRTRLAHGGRGARLARSCEADGPGHCRLVLGFTADGVGGLWAAAEWDGSAGAGGDCLEEDFADLRRVGGGEHGAACEVGDRLEAAGCDVRADGDQ